MNTAIAVTTKVSQKSLFPLSDGHIVARWLNAAKDARAGASYQRVASVGDHLHEFGKLRGKLQEPWVDYQRKLRTAGGLGKEVRFQGLSKKTTLNRKTSGVETVLNKALRRYVFRPSVTYSLAYDTLRGVMNPDKDPRGFNAEIVPGITISEADAVLSLLQLDLLGDLDRLRLCRTCKARWFLAAKKNYRFCGPICRAEFYKSEPEYLPRKRRNQREYRQRLKRAKAFS